MVQNTSIRGSVHPSVRLFCLLIYPATEGFRRTFSRVSDLEIDDGKYFNLQKASQTKVAHGEKPHYVIHHLELLYQLNHSFFLGRFFMNRNSEILLFKILRMLSFYYWNSITTQSKNKPVISITGNIHQYSVFMAWLLQFPFLVKSMNWSFFVHNSQQTAIAHTVRIEVS